MAAVLLIRDTNKGAMTSCENVLYKVYWPLKYPGYQRFFSRAAGKKKTSQKPETALEKSLAPRVPLKTLSDK